MFKTSLHFFSFIAWTVVYNILVACLTYSSQKLYFVG